MRHYEIVFLIHPNHSDQAGTITQHYHSLVTKESGKIHRTEDWGRHVLAYPIKNLHKAHYILLNIECEQKVLDDIHSNFRYNDLILRSLIIKMKDAVTEESMMLSDIRSSSEDNKKPAFQTKEVTDTPEIKEVKESAS